VMCGIGWELFNFFFDRVAGGIIMSHTI
jgi:hypothetical protein